MKTKEDTLEQVYNDCEAFGFDKKLTAEMCWNLGYQLGRKRWHWGPTWWVSFIGWCNTQKARLF